MNTPITYQIAHDLAERVGTAVWKHNMTACVTEQLDQRRITALVRVEIQRFFGMETGPGNLVPSQAEVREETNRKRSI